MSTERAISQKEGEYSEMLVNCQMDCYMLVETLLS